MNPTEDVVRMLHSALGLVGLWGLLFLWRGYRIDAFRQRLFGLRGELFDFAATGHVAFHDPAYTHLRTMLNSMIRFAHRVTFVRFALAVLMYRQGLDRRGRGESWHKALRALPPGKVERLEHIHLKMLTLMVRHMATGSPLLMTGLAAFAAWQALQGAGQRVKELLLQRMLFGLDLLERQALDALKQELGLGASV
jgi:hypothetical protein